MNILICDDEEMIVHHIAHLLNDYCKKLGYTVTISEKIDPRNVNMDEEFDVAFLDIDMPQMNGIVLARKIRNLHPNTIIIFITNR